MKIISKVTFSLSIVLLTTGFILVPTLRAHALTVTEAKTISTLLSLSPEKTALLNALTVTPFSPVVITYGSPVTLKQGESMQFDWTAPATFKKVGILLRKSNGELAAVINPGNTAITADRFQSFTLSVPQNLTPGFYFVTIYPSVLQTGIGSTESWNTSLFKVVSQ